MSRRRDGSLDILRVIGILIVIMGHTEIAELYTRLTPGSPMYLLDVWITMFISMSPPIFFMISGALLLGKEESLRDLWGKRILRIVIVLVFFSLLFYLSDVKSGRDQSGILDFLRGIYAQPRITPLWYLYSYLGFLIILPLLRGIAQKLRESELVYALALAYFLSYGLPLAEKLLFQGTVSLNELVRWDWLLATNIFYPLAGYCLYRMDQKKCGRLLIVFLIADIALLGAQTMAAYRECLALGVNQVVDGRRGICAPVHTVTMFLLLRVLMSRRLLTERWSKLWSVLGGATFGIYLIHPVFLDRIRIVGRLRSALFAPFSGGAEMIPAVLWVLVVFGLSFAVTWILRKLPGVKRFL